MLNFFNSIIEYVEMFFSMFINLTKSIFMTLPMIRMAGDLSAFMVDYVPSIFYSMALVLVGVYFVKFILGR